MADGSWQHIARLMRLSQAGQSESKGPAVQPSCRNTSRRPKALKADMDGIRAVAFTVVMTDASSA